MQPRDPFDYPAWVAYLRAEEPSALAVLLFGSRASGSEGPYSDVDLRVITAGPPRVPDRMVLRETDGWLVHLSIGSRSLAELLEMAQDPARWVYMQPDYAGARVFWDPDGVVPLLNRALAANTPPPDFHRDNLPLALENLMEAVAKVKNAHARGDYTRAVLAAQDVGFWARMVLDALSPPRPFRGDVGRHADWMGLGAAIPGYTANMEVCLGLKPAPRSLDDLRAASIGLAVAVVSWLEARSGEPDFPAPIAALLSAGQVRRYLTQTLTPAVDVPT
jgi:phosphoribosyl-AMP cyclohydrolase